MLVKSAQLGTIRTKLVPAFVLFLSWSTNFVLCAFVTRTTRTTTGANLLLVKYLIAPIAKSWRKCGGKFRQKIQMWRNKEVSHMPNCITVQHIISTYRGKSSNAFQAPRKKLETKSKLDYVAGGVRGRSRLISMVHILNVQANSKYGTKFSYFISNLIQFSWFISMFQAFSNFWQDVSHHLQNLYSRWFESFKVLKNKLMIEWNRWFSAPP